MSPATTAIQTMLITPSAKSDAIKAQQQPMHHAPCLAPDEDRRYWLARFDDEEIVEMAAAYYGRGHREAVAAWRARLAITARR